MSDILRIEGSGRSADLYSWLTAKAKGMEALAGILGFGLPEIENFWFDGAGAGSSWRGARVGRRQITLPLKVYANSRTELAALLSDLSVILDPFTLTPDYEGGTARLFFGMPDGQEWYADVVRSSGGDWARKTDSDDRRYFKTSVVLEAGDAFWTRTTPESFIIRGGAGADEPTLLPRMAKLRVSSAAAFGVKEVSNVGDTFAWPIFRVSGPTTHVILTGANGETIDWTGTLASGETLTIDMRNGIVEDSLGANRYGGLATAPRFWSIAPGKSRVVVQADNTDEDSSIFAQWWPRRWAVV